MMQPQRRCVPLGSIMKLSVGRGLNALQMERGRCTAPYASTLPHHISTAMNEALTQKAPSAGRQTEPKSFTCPLHNAKKNPLLGLHWAEPLGRTGSVFRLQDYRVLQRESDRLLFSEFWRAMSYYPQSFMWSLYTMQNYLLQNWFYFCFSLCHFVLMNI